MPKGNGVEAMTESARGATSRDVTVDAAKGLAITLVVLAHMDRGLFAAGLANLDGWAGRADLWLYSLFIPLFVFLSGLFVAKSSSRVGTRAFLTTRVADLLWLYLVWSLINGLLQVGFNRFTNADMSMGEVLSLWWPLGQMWFLPSLAFATVVVVLLRPWGSQLRSWTVLVILLVVAVATWQTFGVWPLAWLQPELVFFLALGAVIGHQRFASVLDRSSGLTLLLVMVAAVAASVGLLAAGAAVPTSLVDTPDGLVNRLAGVGSALAGIIAAVAISTLLTRYVPPVAAGFAALGIRSLPIFVSHTIFTAGARSFLKLAGIDWIPAYVLFGVASGLLGPLLLFWLAKRFGFGWLYVRPRAVALTRA